MKRLALAAVAALVFAGSAHAQVPSSIAPLVNSSGNVAAATATATLAAAGGFMNYICGFAITGGGATAASTINATLTGLNGGTMTFPMDIVAGVTLSQPTLNIMFFPCQTATALNVAITLSVPSFGAGNTNAAANIWGYRLPY
jgi:hypothetical protein